MTCSKPNVEELLTEIGRDGSPLLITPVSVDPDLARVYRAAGEARKNECHMPGARHHWMGAIRVALFGSSWVRVNVSEDRHMRASAALPKCAKVATVESDDAAVEATWIELVVEHERGDPCAAPVILWSEQERTTLPNIGASLAQRSA
jgi:hypothetical protein